MKNPYYFPIEWDKAGTKPGTKLEAITLYINDQEVSGFKIEDVKIADFMRLFQISNMGEQSGYSNNLSLKKFLGGYYFDAYDLSTSGDGGLMYQYPAVRKGHSRVSVKFDKPTTSALTLLAFCEYSSEINIESTGVVKTNFSSNS